MAGVVVDFLDSDALVAHVDLPASGWSRNGGQWRFQARKDGSTGSIQEGVATIGFNQKLGDFRIRLNVKTAVLGGEAALLTTSVQVRQHEFRNVQPWHLTQTGDELVTP